MRTIGRLLAAGLAAWLLMWHCWAGAMWWGLAASGRVGGGRRLLAFGLAGAALLPWTLWRYAGRVAVLSDRVAAGGAASLGIVDCLGIWCLNLVMAGVGAAVGFPEVAMETAALAVPGGGDTTWRSTRFPGCVPKLSQVVDGARRLPVGGRLERQLAWTYGAPGSSWRGALALTPSTVRATRLQNGVDLRTTVPVDYPTRHHLVLFHLAGRPVGVEEGLFNALEERGWLHPYRLTWAGTVPDGPLPARCEAWSVRLLQGVGAVGQ